MIVAPERRQSVMLAGLVIAGTGLALLLVTMWPTKRVKGEGVTRFAVPTAPRNSVSSLARLAIPFFVPGAAATPCCRPSRDEDVYKSPLPTEDDLL